jgi:predicted signal transduction protein with EAL and GGDEF domain
VALFPSDGHDFETLLTAADGAMYAAKAAGKNRYQLAGEVSRDVLDSARGKRDAGAVSARS